MVCKFNTRFVLMTAVLCCFSMMASATEVVLNSTNFPDAAFRKCIIRCLETYSGITVTEGGTFDTDYVEDLRFEGDE